jgi:putative hydrolase of the HAD superfamily
MAIRAVIFDIGGELWEEYLGTLNSELAIYFASLRPRVRTGILSNSFGRRARAGGGGVRLYETAFLDDVDANVQAAASLGMHAIRFETTEQAVAALELALSGVS